MLMPMFALVFTMASCVNHNDVDSGSGNKPDDSGEEPEIVDPNPKELNALVLTIDNPQYAIDNIYYSSDGMLTSKGDWRFVNLGKVDNIADIKTIPWSTWVESTTIYGGYGLVAYDPKFGFWTLYIDFITTDESGQRTAAGVVYRKGFNGCDQQLTLSDTTLNFDCDGGSESVTVTNKTFTSFRAASDQSWCKAEILSNQGLTFVPNTVKITVEPNTSDKARTANVSVASIWGKNTIISIAQDGIAE